MLRRGWRAARHTRRGSWGSASQFGLVQAHPSELQRANQDGKGRNAADRTILRRAVARRSRRRPMERVVRLQREVSPVTPLSGDIPEIMLPTRTVRAYWIARAASGAPPCRLAWPPGRRRCVPPAQRPPSTQRQSSRRGASNRRNTRDFLRCGGAYRCMCSRTPARGLGIVAR